jgi:hypothetical protein
MHLPYSLLLHLQTLRMPPPPPCSAALEQSQDERQWRLALLEWQQEGGLASAGRLGGAATKVAPAAHLQQVSSR